MHLSRIDMTHVALLVQVLRSCRCAAVATVHALLSNNPTGPGSFGSSTGFGAARGQQQQQQRQQQAVLDPRDPLWQPRDFLPQPWQVITGTLPT